MRPYHSISTHSAPPPPASENLVALDEDVILTEEAPLFHARPATVDVVAEDLDVVAPPREKKKKKSKSASSKMVEGVVEYDLAGFPEDGVVPTEPTHPAMGYAHAPPTVTALTSGAPGFVGPNAMGIERSAMGRLGGGDMGHAGSTFPCSTPGLIQDADTIRALCYEYIDHLITTNRGKIAIPR